MAEKTGFAEMPIEELRAKVLAERPAGAPVGDTVETIAERLRAADKAPVDDAPTFPALHPFDAGRLVDLFAHTYEWVLDETGHYRLVPA